MQHWIVVVTDGSKPTEAYGAYNNSADAQAHKPFDQQTAEGLAANLNQFMQTRGFAVALPLAETMQPGV